MHPLPCFFVGMLLSKVWVMHKTLEVLQMPVDWLKEGWHAPFALFAVFNSLGTIEAWLPPSESPSLHQDIWCLVTFSACTAVTVVFHSSFTEVTMLQETNTYYFILLLRSLPSTVWLWKTKLKLHGLVFVPKCIVTIFNLYLIKSRQFGGHRCRHITWMQDTSDHGKRSENFSW